MNYVKVNTKIYRDNSTRYIELPTILLESNGKTWIFEQLLKYQLKYLNKSNSWHEKLLQAVGMLIDYFNANPKNDDSVSDFFERFIYAVSTGTIDISGNDFSGLYWLAKKPETVNVILYALSNFSDWLSENYGVQPLNPWRDALEFEERLQWMARVNRSEHSFLGHLDDLTVVSAADKMTRNVNRFPETTSGRNGTKIFPEDKIQDLIWIGFKKGSEKKYASIVEKYNWRDIAITLLMHYGGLRHSEVFHIWLSDVFADPKEPDMAIVRVYHPEEGRAPPGLKNPATGKDVKDRATYLLLKYGLLPRNKYSYSNKRYAGWKKPRLDDDVSKYMNVYWFPREAGKLFLLVWRMYLLQKIQYGVKKNHPYAFVSLDPRYLGEMMPLRTQTQSHNVACKRIGLTVSKYNGTTDHGHRHSYGQRLTNAEIDQKVIQVAMHHKSIESQKVYTEPTASKVTDILNNATDSLNEGIILEMKTDIDKWYEEDQKITTKYRHRIRNR